MSRSLLPLRRLFWHNRRVSKSAVSQRLLVALIISLLPLATVAQSRQTAGVPTAFGLKYYFTDAVEAALPKGILRSSPRSDYWREQVQELEWQAGPYNPGLSELLSQQADYFQLQGDHGSAIASLTRAVHVTRVNEGLQTELQIPLVRRLVENHLAQGDLGAADDLQDYLFFLYRENHVQDSVERVDASVEFLDWQRQAWLAELGEQREKRLYNAVQLLEDLLDDELMQAQMPLASHRRLVEMRMRLYYLVEQGRFGVPEDVFNGSLNRGFGSDPDSQITLEERQLQNLQRSAYGRGQRDLALLIERQYAEGDVLAANATRIALADWHLWHNQSKRARLEYIDAYNELSREEYLSYREQWLAQPRELPAGDVYFAPIALRDPQLNRIPVQATFMVNKRGQPRDIDVQVLVEGRAGFRGQLTRWLRAARFRPAVIDRELVDSPMVSREYTILF